jgi:hypothetical protein
MCYTENGVITTLEFLISTIFVEFGGHIFQQLLCWRGKSAVFLMHSSLTSHGSSKTKAVGRQRNLGLQSAKLTRTVSIIYNDLCKSISLICKMVLHSITARFCLRSYYSAIWLPFWLFSKHLSRDFVKTTITAMHHGRWFAYKQTNKYLYCQS